ncbi:MAG: hypothetical protein EOO92_12245 [Pedobacter sp.]|nr:MAG: hypothetical protein EOO92_12245 [Pedobacter sp.]
MEPSTFNLKQSVDNYVYSIKNQGTITSSDEAELSAHLYDATEALVTLGLSEDEAFSIACKRLGNKEVLSEEYSKVNPSLKMNFIWAYLILGFNAFYSLPALILFGLSFLYLGVYQKYETSYISTILITGTHLLLTALIWFSVGRKFEISQFIEKQIERRSLLTISISFVPLLIPILIRFIPILRTATNSSALQFALKYPVHKFDSSIVEFSYYLLLLSAIGAVISMVFSINKIERLTLKALFERPSTVFLLVFGIVVELLAASTRALHVDAIIGSAIIFGSVYFFASYVVTFYNLNAYTNRYLLIACVFGLIMETAVGVYADLDRGDTINTAYFVSLMVIGIMLGKFFGLRSARYFNQTKSRLAD